MSSISRISHDLFSRGVYYPLSHLQRLTYPSRRTAMLAYLAGSRFRSTAAWWTREARRRWILDRLRFAVRRAYAETPYYREVFDKVGFDPAYDFDFEEFAHLPVLTREDIRAAGRDLISRAIPPKLLIKDSTGGSTGEPTEIWIGPEEKGWRESATETFMRRLGLQAGTATGLFWGHHLDPVNSDRMRDRWHSFATNVRWFDCFRLSSEVLERHHREFQEWRPACVIAYASALGQLADHILDHGHSPQYPTQCFVTGGEKLLPHHREAVEFAFRRPVHERYGSRDIGCIGFQTRPAKSLGFEIDWANVLVEPAANHADSTVLITKLHADGMPMIRYRIGDVGRFAEGSRPGHPTFFLDEVLGREVDRIWLPGGKWIHGIQIPHLMKDHPVRQFMVVQRSDYSVEIRIVPGLGYCPENGEVILTTIAKNLPGLSLSLRLVDDLPRTKSNKHRPVISEVESTRRRTAL